MAADNRAHWGGRPVGIYLGESDVRRLSRLAKREGISKSEVVRRLLSAGEADPLLLRACQMSLYSEVFSCSGADIDG